MSFTFYRLGVLAAGFPLAGIRLGAFGLAAGFPMDKIQLYQTGITAVYCYVA